MRISNPMAIRRSMDFKTLLLVFGTVFIAVGAWTLFKAW